MEHGHAPPHHVTSPRFRAAGPDDAETVAVPHADSWRRHYRGAYADSFLDGDVLADRRSVWSARLAAPANSLTVVAEDDHAAVGFAHVVFDNDERWGSLLDNLHVTRDRQRSGIGAALLTRAAEAVADRATGRSMYLWVLEQNTAAQRFYRAFGGTYVEKATVPPPGGVPARLNGSPTASASPGPTRRRWPARSTAGLPEHLVPGQHAGRDVVVDVATGKPSSGRCLT